MVRHRFVFLLGSLILLFITAPIARLFHVEDGPNFARHFFSAAFTATLLASVLAVSKSRITLILFGSLTAIVIILAVCFRDQFLVATHSAEICLLGYTVILIVRHLFTTDVVTLDTICASLCAFLLLGVLWAFAYSLVDVLVPGSFTGGTPMTVDESDSSVLYFSYVTLTTLGYGDISPVKDPARTLAFLEAVTGQLYLVVLVARLVGLHIAHKTVQRMDGEKNSGVSQ